LTIFPPTFPPPTSLFPSGGSSSDLFLFPDPPKSGEDSSKVRAFVSLEGSCVLVAVSSLDLAPGTREEREEEEWEMESC